MGDANETVKKMGQEAGSVKTPTLTLNPEDKKYDMSFLEPSLGRTELATESEDMAVSAGSVDESMLSEEEKKQVEEFVRQIDVANVKMVNSYGASAQKGISTFSSSITGTVKAKEF